MWLDVELWLEEAAFGFGTTEPAKLLPSEEVSRLLDLELRLKSGMTDRVIKCPTSLITASGVHYTTSTHQASVWNFLASGGAYPIESTSRYSGFLLEGICEA